MPNMSTLSQSRNIRVFISSTFKDMQEERSHLVNNIFPLLRQEAHKRGCTITEVDLRWGLTKEEAALGKVIDVCLEEIENSQPFFIGIVGNHYGSTIEINDPIRINNLKERWGDWIETAIINGLSITEIEMLYGVLLNPKDINAYFFIKNDDTEREKNEKLSNLITEIRNNKKDYPVYDYHSVDELGEQIKKEFNLLLNKLNPVQEEISNLDRQRLEQETYMLEKSQHYYANKDAETKLDNWMNDNTQPYMAVKAASGMGKSMLLANWSQTIIKKKDCNVVTYFTSDDSREPLRQMLVYLIDNLTDLYRLPKPWNEKPADSENVIRIFNDYLNSIKGEKPLIIILDAINEITRIDNSSKQLDWLPLELPTNIKILFSTTIDDSVCNAVERRKIPNITLLPLLADQRLQFIEGYFGDFRKKLDDAQKELIMRNKGVLDNNLMLALVVDEIRKYGEFENVGVFIDSLISQTDPYGFMEMLLRIKEESYSEFFDKKGFVDILSLIAISKNGLSENDIVGITKTPAICWSYLYCGNKLLFAKSNGRIRFSHGLIRQAIINKYLKNDDATCHNYRNQVITYFKNTKTWNVDSVVEIPWQLLKLKRWDALYQRVLRIDFVNYYIGSQNDRDFIYYWNQLYNIDSTRYKFGNYVDTACAVLDVVLAKCKEQMLSKDGIQQEIERYWSIIGINYFSLAWIAVNYLQDYPSAIKIAKFLCAHSKSYADKEEYIGANKIIAVALLKQGKIFDARNHMMFTISDAQKVYGKQSIECNYLKADLAEIYYQIGEEENNRDLLEYALNLNEEVLKERIMILGDNHPETATLYANLSSLYFKFGNKEKGEKYQEKAITLYSSGKDDDTIELALEYQTKAIRLEEEKDYEQSEMYARKSIDTYTSVLGDISPIIADSWHVLQQALVGQARYDEATEATKRYEELYMLQIMHDSKAYSRRFYHIALAYRDCKAWKDSIRVSEEHIKYAEENNLNAEERALAYETLACTYKNATEFEKSVSTYDIVADIFLNSKDLKNAARIRQYQGNTAYKAQEFEKSAIYYSLGATLYEQAGLDNTEDYCVCLINKETLKGDDIDIAEIQKAIDIRIDLFGKDDSTAHQLISLINRRKEKPNPVLYRNIGERERIDYPAFVRISSDYPDIQGAFLKGCRAFDNRNKELALFAFSHALELCNKAGIEKDSMMRAHILRLYAYILEAFHKDSDIVKIQKAYKQAINICGKNKEWEMGRICASDMAEFNWNSKNYPSAEDAYIIQLGFVLKTRGRMMLNQMALILRSIAQCQTRYHYSNLDTTLAIAYTAFCESHNAKDKELIGATENTVEYVISIIVSTRGDVKEDELHLDYWRRVGDVVDYLRHSKHPLLSVDFLNYYVETIKEDISNNLALYSSLTHRLGCYLVELGLLQESIDLIKEVFPVLCKMKISSRDLVYHLSLMAEATTHAMQFEVAADCHDHFESPSHLIEQAECYYQLEDFEKAKSVLHNIARNYVKKASIRELTILLKVSMAAGAIDDASKYSEILLRRINESDRDNYVITIATIYLIGTASQNKDDITDIILSVHEAIIAMIQNNYTYQVAYAYHSFIDILVYCGYKYEAKDVLNEYEDYLKTNGETGEGFLWSIRKWEDKLNID